MATTGDIEQKLEKMQSDYLKRQEASGSLPKVISQEWQKAGGEETAALRKEEATKLTDYVSAGARAREKYQDVWNPFSRDTLASQEVALEYKPIADIRSELAMRAEALGVATSSAQSMWGAETERQETTMGFTESAYQRALAKEAEETRQRERAEDIAYEKEQAELDRVASASKSSGSSSSSSKVTSTDLKTAQSILAEEDEAGNAEWGEEADNMLSEAEAEKAYKRILALVGGDTDKADELYTRAGSAGGFKEWYGETDGKDDTGDWGSRW